MMLTNKNLSKTLIHTACVTAISLMLVACEAKTAVRGNLPRDYKLEELDVGKANKNDVARVIGTPSTVGTFDQDTWYYISRKTEQWAFFEPDIIEQHVVVLYFNEQGILNNIQHYTEEDLREIAIQSRETPTSGHELGILEQLLGNFGKFN